MPGVLSPGDGSLGLVPRCFSRAMALRQHEEALQRPSELFHLMESNPKPLSIRGSDASKDDMKRTSDEKHKHHTISVHSAAFCAVRLITGFPSICRLQELLSQTMLASHVPSGMQH